MNSGYQPPTRMLHFFNAPRNCTLDQLKDVSVLFFYTGRACQTTLALDVCCVTLSL